MAAAGRSGPQKANVTRLWKLRGLSNAEIMQRQLARFYGIPWGRVRRWAREADPAWARKRGLDPLRLEQIVRLAREFNL